ncbi:HAD superfamily (subfamily IIIA) phosphatase, TIGR01668 [Gloeothece citriformis PCC 7424]|uniref:HAD superfamily (Subfamily IIIA) phosphatase, TIGR01668 n=1 Tax=Gloeothece citriformis (strain PCC 7424) TaxID=65393 RepID=B7KGB8_GLOC7|nr:YqeG family HAD IIIA-type phosphatase [Gloeothece citriformis]ACK70589.1 HAD superfamily (subfamily IIIA) phosphatase, TIGR01668 [Gloeothece citriformis PCC 7424]
MTKSKILQPDLILGATILHLSPDIICQYDLKGLILDVDETLVPLRESLVSDELKQWVDQVRKVASIWLVSNNISESRIGRIGQTLNVPYIFGAGKPSRRKLRQAIQAMDLPVSQVGMVGDRLFTDVLAGNRLGMFTILVEPMVDAEIAARYYPVRNFEVWLSEKLGVSLRVNSEQ